MRVEDTIGMRVEDTSGNTLQVWKDVVDASRTCVQDTFAADMSKTAVIRLAEIEQSIADQVLDQVAKLRKPKFACKKGCAWCCHAYISATALEVLHIAEYIRSAFSSDEIDAVRQRLTEAVRRNEGRTWLEQENLRQPCPLLVENACSVYPARPLACKGFTARDVAPCRHNATKPDEPREFVQYYVPFREITSSVRVGLQEGLNETPFQNDNLALIPALLIALNDPDIIDRWLEGERVFPDSALEKED